MSTTLKQINQLFESDCLFQILVAATKCTEKTKVTSTRATNKSLISYLNPIHPCYLHIIGPNESHYLKTLSNTAQADLVSQLFSNGATHIVFQNKHDIPISFLTQDQINIVLFSDDSSPLFHYLHDALQNMAIEECTIHGAMVVINGQGILITGDSGTGKSSLLLTLIDRGHLWVADDAPHIYRNHLGHIYVAAPTHLPEYLHIKSIGVVNADQTVGKSRRIPHHRLAAIIHLSDNIPVIKSAEINFDAHKNESILGQVIPKWSLLVNTKRTSTQISHAVLVETIAKQLILNSWGNNASAALISTHDSEVSTVYSDNTREMQ